MADGKTNQEIERKFLLKELPQNFGQLINIKTLSIGKNNFSEFIKISDDLISHVRPKAQKKSDKMETPFGTLEEKKCFWLNANYIKQILS